LVLDASVGEVRWMQGGGGAATGRPCEDDDAADAAQPEHGSRDTAWLSPTVPIDLERTSNRPDNLVGIEPTSGWSA